MSQATSGAWGPPSKSTDEAQARRDWQAYRRSPSEALRNKLMQRYLPVVRFNAERIHAKLPSEVELDDLMSAGLFGLMDAIDGFDLERGIKFETYCAPRVRGAILDELRSMDWVPRLVRTRSSWMESTRRSIEQEHGYTPCDDEIRERMGVDADEYLKIKRDSRAAAFVPLDRRRGQGDDPSELSELDVISDIRQVSPLSVVQRSDLKQLITRGLTRSERLIVLLYYYEQMTMKEIGLTLDLSESRVSQMHSSVLARLRAQLAHRSRELSEQVL